MYSLNAKNQRKSSSSGLEKKVPCDPFNLVSPRAFSIGSGFESSDKTENGTNGGEQANIQKVRVTLVDGTFVLGSFDKACAALSHFVEMALRHRLVSITGLTAFKDRQTVKIRIAGADIDHRPNACSKLISRARRRLGDGGVVQDAQRALETVCHYRLPQSVFRFEMIQQQALSNFGIVGNLTCRSAGKTLARKTFSRRADNPRARIVWQLESFAHARWTPLSRNWALPP